MAKRTKYDLEKMPAPLFPPSFDKLSDATGARIVDAATGEATVEGVVGPSSPTLFSAAGTLFVFVIFITWGIMIIVAYYTHLPTINEQTVDVGADFAATSNHALFRLLPKLPRLVMDIAWIVEGRAPEALPENVLAAMRLNHLDFEAQAWGVEDWLRGPAAGFSSGESP